MLDVLIRAWLGTGRTSGGFHEKKRSHESTWEDRLQVWALGDSSIIRLPISRPFLRSLQGDGGGERICTMVSWHSDGNMNPESGRRPSFPKIELCWHLGGSANDISQTWCGHHKTCPRVTRLLHSLWFRIASFWNSCHGSLRWGGIWVPCLVQKSCTHVWTHISYRYPSIWMRDKFWDSLPVSHTSRVIKTV